MDEREQELFDAIKQQLQYKYQHMAEIQRMTAEVKEALERNDTVSAELILKMRGKEMEQCDTCIHNLEVFIESINENQQKELRKLLKGETNIALWKDRIEELKNLVMRIDYVTKKTIQLDQVISIRLAGTDSFYHAMKK